MKLILSILLIFSTIKLSKNEVLPFEVSAFNENKLKCIRIMYTKLFQRQQEIKGSLVIIAAESNHSDEQDAILHNIMNDKLYRFSVMVKSAKFEHPNRSRINAKTKNYLILLRNSSDVLATVTQWKSLPTWNSMAQVLIIFMKEMYQLYVDLSLEIRKIFQILLHHDMLNVHVLCENENLTAFNILTWYPYENDSCADHINGLHTIMECKFDNDEIVNDTRQLMVFDRYRNISKIPRSLHQCPLKTTVIEWKPFSSYIDKKGFHGIEIALVDIIAQKLQLNPKFELYDLTDNISVYYSTIVNRKSHIMIGGIDENPEMRLLVSSTKPYYQDDLTWCVTKSKPIPVWKNLFNLFTYQVWSALFVVLFVFASIIFFVAKIENIHQNYCWAFLISFTTTLSLSAGYFKPNFLSIRTIYMWVMIYGIVVSILIQGLLISVLTTPQTEMQIGTIRETLTMNFEFAGRKSVLTHYERNDEISSIIQHEYHICKDIDICLKQLETNNRLAIAVSRMHAINNPLIPSTKIFCFSKAEHIFTYPVSILTQHHYHLLPKFNHIIQQVIEFGLIEHWVHIYRTRLTSIKKNNFALATASNSNNNNIFEDGDHIDLNGDGEYSDDEIFSDNSNVLIILTLEHMRAAVYVLAIGYTLSIVIFILEYVSHFHVKFNCSSNRIFHFIDKCFKILHKSK